MMSLCRDLVFLCPCKVYAFYVLLKRYYFNDIWSVQYAFILLFCFFSIVLCINSFMEVIAYRKALL